MIVDQDILNSLFFRFCVKCVSRIESFDEFGSGSCAFLWIRFFFLFEFNYFFEESCLYWDVILRLSKFFRCRELENVVFLLGFILSGKFV